MGLIPINMGSNHEPQVGLVPAPGQENMAVRVKRITGGCKEGKSRPDNPLMSGLSVKVKDHEAETKRSDQSLFLKFDIICRPDCEHGMPAHRSYCKYQYCPASQQMCGPVVVDSSGEVPVGLTVQRWGSGQCRGGQGKMCLDGTGRKARAGGKDTQHMACTKQGTGGK